MPIEFVTENAVVIIAFLIALYELLAILPKVKQNSIGKVIYSLLKKAHELVKSKKAIESKEETGK